MAPRSRRPLLCSLGGGVVASFAGCLSVLGGGIDPESHVEDWHEGPVRGRAAPLDAERTVETNSDLDRACGWAAADAVERAVLDRVDRAPTLRVEYTRSTALPEEVERGVLVQRVLHIGPSGEVQRTPEIGFETLADATPATVGVALTSEAGATTCGHSVYVLDTYQQAD